MKKILFFTDFEKRRLINDINNQLKIKNHLLKLLYENKYHKLKDSERNSLVNKFKDQIMLLDSIKKNCNNLKGREDIQKLNNLIEFYNNL